MRTPKRGLVLACLAGFLVAAEVRGLLRAQAPVFRTGVDVVTVDVTVLSRDGAPRTDLGPDDFTLTVDGKPRSIVSLSLVRSTGPAEAAGVVAEAPGRVVPAGPAASDGRFFLIVVDRDHIPAGEGLQMLDAGSRFIDGLPARDRVAVRQVPGSGSLRFSTDREALKRELRLAVGTYRPPMVGGIGGRGEFMIGRDEALQIEDGRPGVLNGVIARECPPTRNRPTNCPEDVANAAKIIAIDAQQRAQVTLTSVRALIEALASLEGPKHLVLITGGPVNRRDDLSLLNAIGEQAALARVTVHALQVAEPPYQARTDRMQPAPAAIDQTQSAAYMLAGITGGLAMTPASGDVGFGQLTRELSATYLLAFQTAPEDRDGTLHRIDVRVRRSEWGLFVRARKSFRADRSPAAAPSPPTVASTPAVPSEPPATTPSPATSAAPADSARDPVGAADVESLKAALAAYVDRFEKDFSAVVAEERYVQAVHPWRGNPKDPESEPALAWQDAGGSPRGSGPIIARRQLLSDLLLVQASGGRWTGYRDVAVVDGRPVRDRVDRVRDLFLSTSSDRGTQLGRIAAESARYNLGDFTRTVNLPTLTLSFLRRDHHARYRFTRQADDPVGDRPARVLSFTEMTRPTLIGTPRGGNIPIEGRVWLDARDGTVLRTELRFDRGSERRSVIRVDFRSEPPLTVLVPDRMWEWYEGGDQLGRIGGDRTLVQCLAVYSNYRRFTVTTTEQIK